MGWVTSLDLGNRRPDWGAKAQCPSNSAPSAIQRRRVSFCSGRQLAVRLRRRHHLVGVGRQDAADEFALVRLGGHDHAARPLSLLSVEAEVRLATVRILAVAGEAVLGQDRPHVPAVRDGRRRIHGGRQEQHQSQTSKSHEESLGRTTESMNHTASQILSIEKAVPLMRLRFFRGPE